MFVTVQIRQSVQYKRRKSMDRRQQKTRKAIFLAFSNLLEKKNYNSITVQEIIDEANIGRTTFYAHFETKDMLLKTMCEDIFEHILQTNLSYKNEEITFSAVNFEKLLSHILFHLKHNEVNISRILKSESEKEFIKYFKVHIENLFCEYTKTKIVTVPKDFFLSFFVDSFIATARWWIVSKSTSTSEEMARYYMSVIKI